ncbi:VOC family protein [Bowmanella sp. JS7-9]|uniref:VOC family protein n=1 Tax=Pseudobowmanella zhangzhouensis TaxID=1537679 RepID=A0ABW1XLI7_9ALTE|nr:VOC family protein [Bowmanella sp. JS7-9]TBX20300.1 glyoxalase [Bowmanella sp. JS7-9]
MYLEHVNLVVKDLDHMLAFYRAAFPNWRIRDQGRSEWFGKPRTWLHFGDDYHYIALSDHGEGDNRFLNGHSIGFAHFAYVTQNLAATISRLEKAGFAIAKPGADHPFRRNIYFIDPAGFEVEFVEYLSDDPAERNSTLA